MLNSILSKPKPKPVVFTGPDSAQALCRLIEQFGLRKLLLVTDKPLAELGLLNGTRATLKELGIESVVYDGVLPDPTAQVIDDGIDMLLKNKCDSVLAFGGGSSIDSAKIIALAATNNKRTGDCVGYKKCKLPGLPFFAIPTTAGTGSECTFVAVVSDNETHAKDGVLDDKLVPKATALDPVLMQGLPPSITAATGMDALTHAIESYIGVVGSEDTDFYGLAATRIVFEHLPEACRNGGNLVAREAMALASFYGGLAITDTLVGYVHAISHNLGARYGIPHGLGNAMVLPHVLELLKQSAAGKMATLAVHAGLGEAGASDDQLAQTLIDRVWSLNREIGIPATTDVIREEDIDALVDAALKEGSSYATPRYLERHECEGVIRALSA